jgi:porin
MVRLSSLLTRYAAIFVFSNFCTLQLWAQSAPGGTGDTASNKHIEEIGIDAPSIATSLPSYGDPTGLRRRLNDRGVTFSLIYTNDILGNLAGGIRRGVIDQGKLESRLNVDLEKLVGWQGLTFYANTFSTYNTGRIRRDYAGGLNTIAAIEATPSVRLSELWLERSFLNGAATFRMGQLAADAEFFYSDLSTLFLQSDWPTVVASNLPGGGPAYPLSALGARFKYEFPHDASFLLAIFNGDPAGPCAGDPDTCNRYGLNFRLRDPALLMSELQFRWNRGKEDSGLARTIKFGGWTHLGQFADARYDNNGNLLANPVSNGMPLMHRGDYGFYVITDQQVYRPKGADGDGGISIFNRTSISPSDRNLVDLEIDSGIVFAGMVPGRPFDRFGASVIYSRFAERVRAFDQDQVTFGTIASPPRDYEANLELTYNAQIVPGWTLQPDFQYIWHPSGRGIRYPDARIFGLRTIVKF